MNPRRIPNVAMIVLRHVMTIVGFLPALVSAADPDVATRAVTILRDRCGKCHGADAQKGGLRLDSRAAALQGGDVFAPVIVPGKSAESPLYQFISRDDADLKMPPTGPRLSRDELAAIREWIDQGANWPAGFAAAAGPQHWSFQPVRLPTVPVDTDGWSRNAIDAFVLKQLQTAGLSPSPEVDRRTFIRRLSFDLLGLPPSPDDVEAFVVDPNPLAYEKLVDRYLSSPHFGERWARHWLDVVRFAESHGFEMNQARPNAWQYRDYVIRVFNDDKPYDEFVREQIAGDLFGVDEATAFLVGGPWDQVKSPDPVLTAQQRADELHDMVSTTGSAFLGLTIGCSRCHSHKFDPIPQTDYYAIKACFEGIQHGERGIRGADAADRERRAATVRAELADIAQSLIEFEPIAQPGRRIAVYCDDAARTTRLMAPAGGPTKFAPGPERGCADDAGDAARLPNLGGGYLHWNATAADVFTWNPQVAGTFRIWASWGSGWKTHSPEAVYLLDRDGNLESRDDETELGRADHRRFADGAGDVPDKPLWSGFRNVGVQTLSSESRIVLRSRSQGVVTADVLLLEEVPVNAPSTSQPHVRLPVNRGRNVERFDPVEAKFVKFTIRGTSQLEPCLDELEAFTAGENPRNVALAKNGTIATASGTLPGYAIHQLKHVNDGRYGNDWSWISNEQGRGWITLEFPDVHRIDRVEWSRDRDEVPRYGDRLPTDYSIEVSRDGQSWTTVASSADRLPFRQPQIQVPGGAIYSDSGTRQEAARRLSLLAERRQKQSELATLTSLPMVYAGRFVQPGSTLRLHRGDPLQPREAVPPGSLTQFGESIRLPADVPEAERRKALAAWIASPKNPLTARVIVNRLWQHHFGEGLVSTPSDLGINGARPSHPELLDWLAGEASGASDGPGTALNDESGPLRSGTPHRGHHWPRSPGAAWRLKHIHRLICLSATYRQSSIPNPRGLAVDSGNRLLWRYSPQRLEAEPLRDAILAVSGQLNLRMGGPGFDLFEPNTNYVKVYTPKRSFGSEEFRRMIYQSKPRMQLEDTFGAFDCPDAGQIAPKRSRSTTPLQALNLLNSPLLVQQAEFFAARIEREAGANVTAQVRRAFWLAFQRDPSAEELAAAESLIREHGLPIFCRAMLNANEFLMVF